jgi:hypothetical protein
MAPGGSLLARRIQYGPLRALAGPGLGGSSCRISRCAITIAQAGIPHRAVSAIDLRTAPRQRWADISEDDYEYDYEHQGIKSS